jgi:predicted O-linked N-acetylglucosamine transferase (SPINDLY family)
MYNKNNNLIKESINILITSFQKGKYKEAETLAKNILKNIPDEPISWKILGIIYLTSGRFNKALYANQRALKLEPNVPDTYNNLAITFYNLGRYEEAIKTSKEALKIDKNFVQAYGSLADSLKATNKYQDAILYLKQAIKLDPNKVETHTSLADLFHKIGKLDDALYTYENAIKLNSNYYPAYLNKAIVLNDMGRFFDAMDVYNQVIKIKPDLAISYFNLANVQKKLNNVEDAVTNYQKALEFNPNLTDAHYNLANTFANIGQLKKADQSYDKALKINPKNPKIWSNKLLNLNYNENFSSEYIFNQHRLFDKQFSFLNKNKNNIKNKNDRLRVGYVSSDFRKHSVAYFIKALLKNHNRRLIETFCYYNNYIIDETTELLKTYCENWRSIFEMDDQDVYKKIKDDRIDILVDLSGHTPGNKLLVFALKAAPIQITYLGYPNTTGLSTMDYRLTDKYADPGDYSDPLFSEKLIKLNKSFLCYSGNDDISFNKTTPQYKNSFITFGSFNNFKKISSNVIKTWSNILLSIPNSHLILKSSENIFDKNFLLKKFFDQGIKKENIKIIDKQINYQHHMKLYDEIDIALDTFPYNGTTTTFEALWMGVPVITLSGNNHMCRVSSSILNNLNLNNFIGYNVNDYERIAITMSSDKEYLLKLKIGLREELKKSNLCDGKSFTREVEEKFYQIYYENK